MEYILWAQDCVDLACEGSPAWKIVLTTAGTTLLLVWTKEFIFQDEDLFSRGKKMVFRWARKIPMIQSKISAELDKVSSDMLEEMNQGIGHAAYITVLPEKGWTEEKIIEETKKYINYGKYQWKNGYSSGTVYNGNQALTELMTKVYGLSAWSNPLHPDVFPGVRKMEAEIVRICCNLFNGDKESCGAMTSGGTESIVIACKAYRDYAINERGIKKPEMLVPITAHAAFDKGAQILNMKIRHIPINSVTMKVDIRAMEKMINRNTCMLVGSAPQFPHGAIDSIEEIGALGIKYKIPVHVDACLGGFLIAFMDAAGYPLNPFDFRVKGVTSISADTHKYGYAPKGSSVIMYSEAKYRHHQFFVSPDWPGGIYATATISGSRSGGIIAACWAAMVYHGAQGYIDYTKKIIQTAKFIEQGCREIPGIFVLGKPDVSVIAIGSDKFNIYQLFDGMGKRGWNLNALQFPSSIHLAITVLHTEPGVADRFIKDVEEITADIMKDPSLDKGGSAAIYGMAQSIPDRSVVDEIAWGYLDAVYSTETVEK